jgi:hypothetical protein
MSEFDHLASEVIPVLERPRPERVAFCREDRWIGYTCAAEILKKLSDLVIFPRTLRMPNVLVVGRSGNGKSSLLERFRNLRPPVTLPDGSPNLPILQIEMPETPTENELWSTILWALAISHREKDPVRILKREAKSALVYARVRVLVIDEFNNLTNAGRKAGDLLAAIKGISNQLKLSIVAAGTEKAVNALNSDAQMKSRFTPAPLSRWALDKEYLRLLASYERLLPLAKPSNLTSRELASALYSMGGDTIGGTVKLLKEAAARAVETEAERITPALLQELGWTKSQDWDAVSREV